GPGGRGEVAVGRDRAQAARSQGPGPDEAADVRRSAATQIANDSPQAHSWMACGLFTLNPPPSIASLNSMVDPATMGALFGSTSVVRPWAVRTMSSGLARPSNESL